MKYHCQDQKIDIQVSYRLDQEYTSYLSIHEQQYL